MSDNDLASKSHKTDVGAELAEWRERAGLSQKEAARLLDLGSDNTISRWETGTRAPGALDYKRAMELYRRLSAERHLETVPRGTGAYERATWLPGTLHAVARRFELELARLGATNEEVDHIDATLHSEHVATLVNQRPDGSPRTDEERNAEFRLQMRALLRWLLMRMDALGRAPDGDLAAVEQLLGPPSGRGAQLSEGGIAAPRPSASRKPESA